MVVSVIDRTWNATDDCGNRSTCVQRITVRDSTPPEFVVEQSIPPVEDGEEWILDPPLAVDECGEVIVSLHSVETNSTSSGSQLITYVWVAVDESGNTTEFRQTIERLPALLPNPRLSISWNNGMLRLDWPAQPEGWWLESNSSWLSPDWNPVRATPVLSNGRYAVELAPSGPAQWFRLAAGAPPLAIAPAGPGSVMLTWPSLATGYSVERCTDLAGGLWVSEPGTPITIDGMNQLEVQTTGFGGFFRLVRLEP
jgi:hypothetical protein